MIEPAKCRRVLCISVSGIGNTILFTPFAAALKKHRPGISLDLATWTAAAGECLEGGGLIENFFHFPADVPGKLALIGKLRRRRYDCLVTAFPSNRWPFRLLAYLIGAPARVGHAYRHGRMRSLAFLVNHQIEAIEGLHDAVNNLRLLEPFAIDPEAAEARPLFFLDEASRERAAAWLAAEGIGQGVPLMGIHAGAGRLGARKKWGLENFAGEAREFLEKHGNGQVVLFGGREEVAERWQLKEMIGPTGVHVFAGCLKETAALIGKCTCFLSNDSALMHVAAVMKVKQRAIFVATRPDRTRPLNDLAEVTDLTEGTDYPYPFRSCRS